VLYYAAKKTTEAQLKNVQLLRFDVENLPEIFDLDEVDRFLLIFVILGPNRSMQKDD